MGHLFLASDADVLAARLLGDIADRRAESDLFEPITIVVPNRFVQQWLTLRMARDWHVAANLQFLFLEHALWDWLRELDPRPHPQPPELLDEERYSLLVLSILLQDRDASLESLQAYFGANAPASRMTCRRAWQLAHRLGGLVRDYEYHRQEKIIQKWLRGEPAEAPPAWREREASQRAVFQRVTHETDGRRAMLNQALGRNFKTLPQFVMEFVHEIKEYRSPRQRVIHLFGLSQISPLHMRALDILGKFHELRLYHLNPLASRAKAMSRLGLQKFAHEYRQTAARPDALAGTELLHAWGRAAAEGLHLTAEFLRDPRARVTLLPSPKRFEMLPTVLDRVQDLVLGGSGGPRLPQDETLQVMRCPGIWREVETIHAGIVRSLESDAKLRQTDVAVLVSDMERYRPVLTAVFERPPRRISFALADYSAARVSVYGQALVGMLDLALENLTRTRVFEVLLNPCVLARLGVGREDAVHWLTWAKSLGIYHGWDASEKREQGYAESSLYSWKLGLQKLRLGQYMDVTNDTYGHTTRWGDVVPCADAESADRERLDPFCRAVEGLLPTLVRLRRTRATARQWRQAIVSLMQRFLAVPDDRPEEEAVRAALIASLERLGDWDVLQPAESPSAKWPLALVREYVISHLRGIPARRNVPLASGVTVAALMPQRPVPFEVVFLAGMGEKDFPGGASPSPFDLRQMPPRQMGDVLPVEQQRYGFLEAVLSARRKLVITYNARDLQKDADLQPSTLLVQLRRFVAANIIEGGTFRDGEAPLAAHAPASLEPELPCHDVLGHDRTIDRVLSIDLARDAGRLILSAEQDTELDRRKAPFIPHFSLADASGASEEPARGGEVSLVQLRDFLDNPAAAAMKYHLGIRPEWEDDTDDDHEPIVSASYTGSRLIKEVIERAICRAETASVDEIVDEASAVFTQRYREGSLRGQLPEGAFAEVDIGCLQAELQRRLDKGGVRAFLESRAGMTWSGPVLIGESFTPVGARRRLPALVVPLTRPLKSVASATARIVGHWPFVWERDDTVQLLVFDDKDGSSFDRVLFDPLLFVAALAAVGDLKGRSVALFRLRSKRIDEVTLAGDLLDAVAARDYLAALATDCLDRRLADQLPFKCAKSPALRGIYQNDDEDIDLGHRLVCDWRELEADRSWGHREARLDELTDVGFRVPDNAASLLRRRLRPLFQLLPAGKKGGDE